MAHVPGGPPGGVRHSVGLAPPVGPAAALDDLPLWAQRLPPGAQPLPVDLAGFVVPFAEGTTGETLRPTWHAKREPASPTNEPEPTPSRFCHEVNTSGVCGWSIIEASTSGRTSYIGTRPHGIVTLRRNSAGAHSRPTSFGDTSGEHRQARRHRLLNRQAQPP